MAELFDRYTGEYLRDTIVNILHKYNINVDQVYTCTTDNGRNMLKCISLINEYVDEQDNIDDEPNSEFDNSLDYFTLNTKCIGECIQILSFITRMANLVQFEIIPKMSIPFGNEIGKISVKIVNFYSLRRYKMK